MAQPNERGVGLMRADVGGIVRGAGKGDSLPATSAGSATQELRADLCVIGGGSGGLSVAAAAAQLGVSVVLIEKHRMGGDCLNYGCVPSKSLLAAARRAQEMRSSGRRSSCRTSSARTSGGCGPHPPTSSSRT